MVISNNDVGPKTKLLRTTNGPRLLDLFCGAGGAAMGYHRAGFEVVGVDINPQPRYPFEFHQTDALTFPLDGFDVIHASPPCQRYSAATAVNGTGNRHPALIGATRRRICGLPYVIENVPRSPLHNPVLVCGVVLGLWLGRYVLRRHRLFESNLPIEGTGCGCRIGRKRVGVTLGVYGGGPTEKARCLKSKNPGGGRPQKATVEQAREIMGMPWALKRELNEAIPPAYTEWIGRQILERV